MNQAYISVKEIETGDIIIEYIDRKDANGNPIIEKITIQEGGYQDFFMALTRFMDEEF